MKVKRIAALTLAAMLLAMPAGWAQTSGAKVVLGIIDIADVADSVERVAPGRFEVVTFPTMNEVLAALKAGRIDAAQVMDDYASFMMKSDDSLQYQPLNLPPASLTMLTRTADSELAAKLNSAIVALRENGRLDELYRLYVASASPDNVPEAPAPQILPGAETVVVGVSGDFAPHDYVSVSGQPVGFNVALMGEISKLAGFNVQFVTVPFSAKFAALSSGRIDLFFLHAGVTSFEGITRTEAYDDNAQGGLLTLKK